MNNVQIISINETEHGRRGEAAVVARFTADVGGVRMQHCALIRKPDGFLFALPTQGKVSARAISFPEKELDREFNDAAVLAYSALVADREASE